MSLLWSKHIQEISVNANVDLLFMEYNSLVAPLLTENRNVTHLSYTIDLSSEKFANSYIKKISEQVQTVFPFTRLVARQLAPLTCYKWHSDDFDRVCHLPIVSNNGCFFIFDDVNYRLKPNGNVYIVDTSNSHTFVNSGEHNRIHYIYEI